MRNHAKIVCTLGPATSSKEQIRELIDAGMNVARLNFSHGSHDDHAEVYRNVREASAESGLGIGTFVDLQGPKIRLGSFIDGSADLVAGQELTITTRSVLGTDELVPTTYMGLPGDVSVGDPILIDDGKVRLEVTAVADTEVATVVRVPGKISNHKGINLPGVAVSVPAMSNKDIEDLRFGLHLGVDFIALSFVRDAADAEDVRAVMREEGVLRPVIAKIEKPQAVDNLDGVIAAFDGVMVARGDLGVECPLQDVPLIQKRIITKARKMAKPVIVATQMLESMITSPAPTRAEASDCANAVLDGADALMLSGETSVGEYPAKAVQVMSSIIAASEDSDVDDRAKVDWHPRTRGGVIAKAATEVAERIGAKCLVAFTASGDSARRVARHHGSVPILAFTPDEAVRSQLALSWGVEAFLTDPPTHTDEMVHQVDEQLLKVGRVQEGDLVVIIAGSPPGIPGSTNALRIHRMGDAINGLAPAYQSDV